MTADIIELAPLYARYGYRKIAKLLRDAGWLVSDKRVERIWRREGLKVPKKPTRRAVVMAAAHHFARRLLDHLMNMNNASCPRMPRVKDLALFGPMGVASSRCTIRSDRIRALTTPHQIMPTSPRCQSAWQPTPADAPLIDAENLLKKPGPAQSIVLVPP